jgi:hypothetical protein
MITRILIALAALLLASCSDPAPPAESKNAETTNANFVNKVWSVTHSTAVAPGTLYVFLSEGTLVITSPGNTPMVGKWSSTPDGLTMTEESIDYRVEILKLTDSVFTIRSHNPGEPVEIEMKAAPSP